MTSRISPEEKSARSRLRQITRETERVLDRIERDGFTTVRPDGLAALVALGTGLLLPDVQSVVHAYMSTRHDFYLAPGKTGGWKKKMGTS